MAPPFRKVEFEILYGLGISREGELIDLGVQQDIVEKSGSWYSYQGDRIGQGKDTVRTYLIENPAPAKQIEAQLLAKLLPGPVEVPLEEADESDAAKRA